MTKSKLNLEKYRRGQDQILANLLERVPPSTASWRPLWMKFDASRRSIHSVRRKAATKRTRRST